MSPLLLLLFACPSPSDEGTDSSPTDSSVGTDTGETGSTTVVDPRFEDLPAVIEAELNSTDAPSVSVAVIEKGELVFAGAYGSKSVDGSEPVNTNTLFQIGSVTKMFTALVK